MTREGKCCICGADYTRYGNNAEPLVRNGRCCGDCDGMFVIPARIFLAQGNSKAYQKIVDFINVKKVDNKLSTRG